MTSAALFEDPTLHFLVDKNNLHAIDIKNGKYTGEWIGIETGKLYASSQDFMDNYDGSIPDIYVPKQKYYNISFESNKGSAVNAQLVAAGDKIVKPEDPKKQGYTFEGWYTDTTWTTLWDFDTIVTNDITLYTKWNAVSSDEGSQTYTTNTSTNTDILAPNTSDNTKICIYISMIVVSCFAIVVLVKRRKNHKENYHNHSKT